MSKSEFMDSLRRALAGSLTSSTVNENMRYYEEYFDTEIRSGRSEAEVTASLGDPRLLAKTIIDAAKYQARNGGSQEYDEVYEDGTSDGGYDANSRGYSPRIYRMPGWLLLVIVLAVIFVVAGIIGSVVSMLLPFIIPVVCVVFIFRMLRRGG